MKITVVGAGGAFAGMKRGNSAFLVEHMDRKILIDCGMTVPYVLRDEMGIPLESITDIIVTHTHSDHTGGLEMVLHACRWLGNRPPSLWCMPDVRGLIDAQFKHLVFEKTGEVAHCWTKYHLNTDVQNTPLGGLPLTFYKVNHVGALPAYAVRLGPLAVSGDTREPVFQDKFWDGAILIFHECEFGAESLVHTPAHRLVATADRRGVDFNKLWGYHCPEMPSGMAEPLRILQKGMVFEL